MKKVIENHDTAIKGKINFDFLCDQNLKSLVTKIMVDNPVPVIEDFEERTNTNWYTRYFQQTPYAHPRKDRAQWERYHAESRLATLAFMEDARKHAIYMGVPEQYAAKVVERAWEDGHADGYDNVFLCLQELIGIFK